MERNRTVTIQHILEAERADGARGELPARGEEGAGRVRGQALQRHRRLQGDRGGVLHARLDAEPRAGAAARPVDGRHRRRAGTGRLSLHRAHRRIPRAPRRAPGRSAGRTCTPATSCTTPGTCTRRRSRTSRRPGSGRSSTWRSRTRTSCATCSARASGSMRPATRRSSWRWSSCGGRPATSGTSPRRASSSISADVRTRVAPPRLRSEGSVQHLQRPRVPAGPQARRSIRRA